MRRLRSPCASCNAPDGEADIGGTCIALPLGCTVRKRGGEVSSAAKRRIGGAGSWEMGFLGLTLCSFHMAPRA